MVKNTKQKGNRNENRSARLLEAAGYSVTRSRASLGCFDLVALSASDIILVQVKSNRWPSAVELDQMRCFTAPPNARKLIHRWDNHQRLPHVKEIL